MSSHNCKQNSTSHKKTDLAVRSAHAGPELKASSQISTSTCSLSLIFFQQKLDRLDMFAWTNAMEVCLACAGISLIWRCEMNNILVACITWRRNPELVLASLDTYGVASSQSLLKFLACRFNSSLGTSLSRHLACCTRREACFYPREMSIFPIHVRHFFFLVFNRT